MVSSLILLLAMVMPVGNYNTHVAEAVTDQGAAYCQSFSIENVPKPHSMLSGETRKWYNGKLSEIPKILDSEEYKSLSEREKAITASILRNCFKYTARDAMKCVSCADYKCK